MSKIHLLDESTINKIAAGEVIERPASVVKELVENSIDAGATEIIIKLKEGGKKQISVIDNGQGMDKEDLLLCVKKHATSKIQKIEDVYSIYSYGFRGEALATIAEVSKFEIISATESAEVSNKVSMENGKIKNISQETKRKGTEINVYNLFYTVPARQKFLKTDAYELKKIMDWIRLICISNYKVAFKMIHDNKTILDLKSAQNYEERLKQIFDFSLIKADYKDPVVDALIYFSKPSDVLDMGNARQAFYINDRPIRNETISKAIYKAFESKIPRGKKPNCFVFLKIDPRVVDINVHPQKLEVRVKNENLFYFPVYEGIKKKLESGLYNNTQSEEYKPEMNTKIISLLGEKYNQSIELGRRVGKNADENIISAANQVFGSTKTFSNSKLDVSGAINSKNKENQVEGSVTRYKIIGQVFDTYIVVETIEGNLLLIDQHVAEERYYFEKFQQDYKENKKIESQALLVPISINLEASDVNLVEEKKTELQKLGLDLDVFGQESIIIRRIPMIMNKLPSKEELKNMIVDLVNEQGTLDSKINGMIATMACKTSIKAETPLSEVMMRQIIDKLFATKNPYTCPHGRPTMFQLSKTEIEKKVGRI